MSDETPQSVRQHISVQRMGDETLLYDRERHRAFCLNASSSAVWRLADGTRTVAEIARDASLELGAVMDEDLVRYGIEELRRDGLMEPSPSHTLLEEHSAEPSDQSAQAMTRRAMLQRLGVGGAMLLPAVASIVAPTAAQAYSGCVDCTDAAPGRAARARRQQSSATGTAAGDPQQ